ncbi:hypothetical protein [Euzebya sp.]|uniref:hypothetical protein n=2 Tax=Euzebya sp. TaxID=1971409 RepID=UPI0035153C29
MLSLRTRLMSLALAPAVVAGGFAAATVLDRLAAADAATRVADEVDVVVRLVAVDSSLTAARIPYEVESRLADTGFLAAVPPAVMADVVGAAPTPAEWIDRAAPALDRLPPAARPLSGGDLRRLELGAFGPTAVADELDAISVALTAGVEAQLSRLQDHVLELGVPEVTDPLDELVQWARAYGTAGPRVEALADIAIAAAEGEPLTTRALTDLAVRDADFDRAVARLTGLGVDVARRTSAPIDDAVAEVLDGAIPRAFAESDVMGVARIFLDGITEHRRFNDGVVDASQVLRAAADDLAAGARRSAIGVACWPRS